MNILEERINNAKSICIIGHQNPDGDCIGSTLAIYNYIINKYGQDKVVKSYLDEFSKKFMVLPNADKISQDDMNGEKFDLCIVVDSGSVERLGKFKRYFEEAKDTIVFDHHENNTIPAKVSIIDPESIATCEIIYSYIDKKYLDKNIAMCLYIGIATDSGVFRYKATTKKTFSIAGELIDYGFDFTSLLDKIVFDNSINQRRAQGLAFDRIKTICNGKVSFSYLLDDELAELNLKKSDIDNIIVYLREIDSIVVAGFAYSVGNNIFKLSLRSKDDKYNLSEFAKMHDGGGHRLAAGCMYYGSIDKVLKNFEKDMSEFIEKS